MKTTATIVLSHYYNYCHYCYGYYYYYYYYQLLLSWLLFPCYCDFQYYFLLPLIIFYYYCRSVRTPAASKSTMDLSSCLATPCAVQDVGFRVQGLQRWMEEILHHLKVITSGDPEETLLTLITDTAGRCKIYVIGTNPQSMAPRAMLRRGRGAKLTWLL